MTDVREPHHGDYWAPAAVAAGDGIADTAERVVVVYLFREAGNYDTVVSFVLTVDAARALAAQLADLTPEPAR